MIVRLLLVTGELLEVREPGRGERRRGTTFEATPEGVLRTEYTQAGRRTGEWELIPWNQVASYSRRRM